MTMPAIRSIIIISSFCRHERRVPIIIAPDAMSGKSFQDSLFMYRDTNVVNADQISVLQ